MDARGGRAARSRCYDPSGEETTMTEQPTTANPYAPPAAHVEDVDASPAGALATRGSRLAAAIVDVIVAMVVWGIVAVITPLNIFRPDPTAGVTRNMLTAALGFVLFVAVHGYWLATQGQTLGKVVLKVRILRTDGSRASFARIVLARYLPTTVLASVPYIGPIYALVDSMVIFRESRSCLHDHIADTIVVKA